MAAATAKAAAVLLILSVAFTAATIAAAHHHPPSSNKTKLLKACSDALGPGGGSLVTFCARDFLGHKAARLANCGPREVVDVVLEESYKKAKAFEDFESKIIPNESLRGKELRDLSSCWGLINNIVSSVGDIYGNIAVKKLSIDVVLKGTYEKVLAVKGKCNFSAPGRHNGLWLELKVKAKESLKAEIVALAFMNQFHSVLN